MKKINFKNLYEAKVAFCYYLVTFVLILVSCSDKGENAPTINPEPTITEEMYIILDGKKVICKVPTSKYDTYVTGTQDTGVEWFGNLNAYSDTSINIWNWGPRVLGVKYKFSPPKIGNDIVAANIRWSYISGKPNVIVDGGDYTFEKIKGKWVSTLKNGTGYDYNDKTKKYTVAFRMIWP